MNGYWTDRGEPWEYDPGPPRNRKWSKLFAQTPNYRGLGKAAVGKEKFRWHFGPMFYRGRLRDDQVKVLVVGQEGAQDECLSHRSFTGGTGARMQHFLNHIGITESYLFLNTFVYPINGQYTSSIKPLAQKLASPVVSHRHEILNYVLARNEVHLVVAVGRAAKETVATWVESLGGNCPDGSEDISTCTSNVLGSKTKCVGVVHPGSSSKGTSTATIVADFKEAIVNIDSWAAADPNWLPSDAGGTRSDSASFTYGRAPIPFRDFPLGIPWRLGRGGTSSGRKDNQRSIQIFAQGGQYRFTADYRSEMNGSKEGYAQDPGDVPYEPPKSAYTDYDTGPGEAWARLLMGGKAGYEWPDFAALGVTAHQSLGWGPIYRGRTKNVQALILADQRSQDDLFTFRASTGDQGQHLQALLSALGLTESYLILRVLPVDTLDLSVSKRKTIVNDAQVRKVYGRLCSEVLARNPGLGFAFALGPVARHLAPHVVPAGVPLRELQAYSLTGWKQSWLGAQTWAQGRAYSTDLPASFAWDGERAQIPRHDLPFGTLRWQGSSDDRAQRGKVSGKWSPHYYKISLPKWVNDLSPVPLTAAEQAVVQNL